MTFFRNIDQVMEAEQLNIIANRLIDLSERNHALRGYL
jgi:peptide chain release factor 2